MAAEQPTLLDQTKQTVADLSTKVADTLSLGGSAESAKSKDAPTGGEFPEVSRFLETDEFL